MVARIPLVPKTGPAEPADKPRAASTNPFGPKGAPLPKSRAAISNPKVRFDRLDTETVDDGWATAESEAAARDDPPPDPRTEITLQPAKSIITRNNSPDIPFGQSINPYRGCEHGCIYCFARPTHAFLGLSPGLDFETKIIARPNAAQLLDAELRKPGYRCESLAVGTNTDPYQPAERRLGIFRDCLKVMAAFNQPVSIVTKSHLITRDLDILAPMAAKGLASVGVSVTTLNRDLARDMEPRASVPSKRLDAIRALIGAGVPTIIMVAPVVPVLTDHEMERVMAAGHAAGALDASYILMRLPLEVRDLFVEWIETRFPAKAKHVLSLIRQQRDGQLNDAQWGRRMKGQGEFARLLATRFSIQKKRLAFPGKSSRLNTTLFAPPPKAGDQLRLAL